MKAARFTGKGTRLGPNGLGLQYVSRLILSSHLSKNLFPYLKNKSAFGLLLALN